ncbi:MAG: hypothetical protein K2N87_02270, partial [Eubacterium sp.]|nr:hypothetical protein [Eubacterium sp.]
LTVYQPKDFDPANPVYKVKVWDKSGEQAGNGFPPPTTGHHIFSVHTAAPSKGAAGFFYSAHFYLIPGHIKEGKAVSL